MSNGVPIPTWDGELGELASASTANGGTALTNGTPVYIPFREGTSHLFVTAASLNGGASVVQFTLNPYMMIYKTTDNFATGTDYSQVAQQPNPASSVVLDAMGTLVNGYAIMVGSHLPFRGVNVTMSSLNIIGSVLTVTYWNGTAWTSIAKTDGTAAAGATFGQSGNVTWTVPSAWTPAYLRDTGLGIASDTPQSFRPLYWTRWEVSVALSATTRASQMLSMARYTTYAELMVGQSINLGIVKGLGRIGCIEATVGPAGTGTVIVNTSSRYGTGYVS